MQLTITRAVKLILITAILASSVMAQAQPKPTRVRAPVTVRGLVGGEAGDIYVVQLRKNRLVTMELSWRQEEDNTASFGVSASPSLDPVNFGKESDGGRKWVGRIPKTGDYFVEVMAHPAAHYTLKISIK
ncbi:MAG TPA: hypothetical protein VE961_11495 [Pyrinomonadaceae bacterium]|nr:hypothetical protein [Pyrinomonadaceae bacterium]